MKRLFALVTLAIGLSLCLPFAAAQQTVLSIAHTMTGGGDRDAFNQIVASFEASHPNIKIKQIVQDDDLYEDTGEITLLKSNNPPDLYFEWGGARVANDVKAGFAADLTDVMNEGGWKDTFDDIAWSKQVGTTYQGKIYMVPTALDVSNVIWYNTDIFKKYGLSVPKTWSDLMTVVDTLHKNGVTPFIFGNKQLWPFGNWAAHVVAQFVSPKTFDAAFSLREPFDQPEFVKAFGLFQQLAQHHAFNADMATLGADPATNDFFQGYAAMHPIGSWLVPIASDSAPKDFHYDEFVSPASPDAKGAVNSIIGVATGFVINAKSKHFDEAVTFMKYFTSLKNQIIWTEGGDFSPVKGAIEQADLNPHMAKLAKLFDTAGAIVPPPDTGYSVAVADAFYQGAAYVAGGLKTPKEALEWIDKQLKPLKSSQ